MKKGLRRELSEGTREREENQGKSWKELKEMYSSGRDNHTSEKELYICLMKAGESLTWQ